MSKANAFRTSVTLYCLPLLPLFYALTHFYPCSYLLTQQGSPFYIYTNQCTNHHREKKIDSDLLNSEQWKAWECHVIPLLWHKNHCYHTLTHTCFLSLYAFASSVSANTSWNNKVSWEIRTASKCLQSHIAWWKKKKNIGWNVWKENETFLQKAAERERAFS